MRLHTLILTLPLLAGSARAADAIDNIPPGEWFEAPNSKMSAVTPNPVPEGNSGVKAVMSAWNGGSFDTKRNRLVIWGGGHADYSGNEVYVFAVDSLKWKRVSEPSLNVGGDEASGVYPDGKPRSRHTYNYVQYVAAIDRFCTFGGAVLYRTGAQATSKTHCFDFETKAWEQKADALATGIGAVSGQDPETGHIWVQGGGKNGVLAQWDPVGNAWKKHAAISSGWFDYRYTAAAGRGKLVALGANKLFLWDLRSPAAAVSELTSSGDTQLLPISNPGLAYDTKRKYFVAWNGGTDVYLLDIGTRKWLKVQVASTNKVVPTTAEANGTFGRFQYIPSKDVFIAVNRISENVYFFRLPEAIPPVKIGGKSPLNGKVEINILNGASFRSYSGELPIRNGFFERGALSCRIFSVRNEMFYAQGIPSANQVTFQLEGHASGRSAPSGAYFLQVLQGGTVILARPFHLVN